jgi:hypothetical protein
MIMASLSGVARVDHYRHWIFARNISLLVAGIASPQPLVDKEELITYNLYTKFSSRSPLF